MKKKKAAIFFDKNDYQLLEIVNDIQERGEASKAFHSLLAEYLHPQGIKELKIRSCFSEAEESEKVNCVPESAATQHIEATLKRTNGHPDNGSGLCCQYRFLEVELRTWANRVIAHRFARSLIFLKVGFNRIISIDDVIIRAGR